MLTHLTDLITTFITNLYVTTGLVGIVVAMAIESCCIPLPSEIVMPLAGVMLATGKILSGTSMVVGLVLIALAGSIGSLIGSMAAYGIGYAGGRPLMLKYGRYVLISKHDADRADAFFKRWGSSTTFFSRLLPVIRTYISLPAGITRMSFVKFCIYTLLGSFPWCLLLAFVGYKLGQTSSLSTVFHGLDVVILVAIVILVALYIWRHINNDRKARAARAAQSAAGASPAQMTPQQNGWNYQQQPQQSPWGQPQQPYQPQPPSQQSAWSQVPTSPSQAGWGQQPAQYPQQPQQAGWGQQPPAQSPQPGWGQPLAPTPGSPPQPQQPGWGQPPEQQGWPAQSGNDGWNGQRR